MADLEGTDARERGVTPRRIAWSTARADDWARAIRLRDRKQARELYEELGRVLREEIAEEGGRPVLSTPATNDRIRARLATMHGRRALDLGCGPTPVAALSLAEAGFEAYGVDVAHSIVSLARDAAAGRARVVVGDGERLPFPDRTFDIVTCDDTLEHAFDQQAMVSEIARVLRPGGRALIVTPNASGFHVWWVRARDLLRGRRLPREAYHITHSHTRELRWDELSRLFRPWFSLHRAERTEFSADGTFRALNRVLRLPGMWRFGVIHFLEFQRKGAPPTAAGHYASLQDPDSQTSPGVVGRELAEWLRTAQISGPVLDLGCGVGSNLAAIAGSHRAVGTDLAVGALQAARRHAPVAAADGARLPFADATFGAVVCTEVLEHTDDRRLVLSEIARVLRPGGLAFVTTPNYANLAGAHKWLADRRSGAHDWNPWGAHEGGYEAFITARRLLADARPYFHVERTRGLDFGQALTGRFAAIDAAAWSRPGRAVLDRLLPRMERAADGRLARHGMHTELVLRKPGGTV